MEQKLGAQFKVLYGLAQVPCVGPVPLQMDHALAFPYQQPGPAAWR